MPRIHGPNRAKTDKRLKTNARFWELALGCRVDAETVRDIQGCTPK